MSTLETIEDRIIVIGSGLAGLVTALSLAPQPVTIVTRAALGAETSSAWAQGGIAASMGADDRAALHAADTLAAGDGLCDLDIVEMITSAAPAAIAMLERFGVRFDRNAEGKLALGLEAAHGRRRIVHAGGDGSGAEIMRSLTAAVLVTPSISVMSGLQARRLLVDDHGITGLLCASASGPVQIAASRVVLATGGLGGLYDATTNPSGNYGQGIMLAARAGAVLSDMEFVQFHPTALDVPLYPQPLVSEAVRGEGAVLVNERGERFMVSTPGAELAPRDVVARAISAERARGGTVALDARTALGRDFSRRFPAIGALCRTAGIDPSTQPIPVRPAAHYHMGGVETDCFGRTLVAGLWAAGEVACTGLHGANRLASNSLLEAAVMGMRVAEDVAGVAPRQTMPSRPQAVPPADDIAPVRAIVSAQLGVLRDVRGLQTAIADLLPLVEAGGPASDPAVVALLIAVFAHARRHCAGAHARTDFPQSCPDPLRQRMTLDDALSLAHAAVFPAVQPYARSA
ncbi:L-aspartate oxidase [Agrobacterium vitis]|uniref:L-aspartate oxidase n=1 Tax=Agrobacterium vitis TaxID=373 RepID=A0A6L6V836_AGRVI|nr:L-aspartate oxidase [Agrobacterium vitis]MUZ71914.1 L-aspartate oxidase [Agrobacterium vitis]